MELFVPSGADWNLMPVVLLAQLFERMYPNEEFFPETTSPENPEDDNGLILET